MIHGLRERHFEAVWFDRDAIDLERHPAAPLKALQSERLDTPHGPSTICTAGDEVPARRELDVQNSGGKTFAKRIAGSLPHAVDLFSRRTHQDRKGVISQKHLAIKRPEFALSPVHAERRNRSAHADVGKNNCVWDELFHAFFFRHNPSPRFRHLRDITELRGVLVPFEAGRMTVKAFLRNSLQTARTIPRPLTLHIEQRTVFIESNAAGTAESAGEASRFSVGSDFHHEATKQGP